MRDDRPPAGARGVVRRRSYRARYNVCVCIKTCVKRVFGVEIETSSHYPIQTSTSGPRRGRRQWRKKPPSLTTTTTTTTTRSKNEYNNAVVYNVCIVPFVVVSYLLNVVIRRTVPVKVYIKSVYKKKKNSYTICSINDAKRKEKRKTLESCMAPRFCRSQ